MIAMIPKYCSVSKMIGRALIDLTYDEHFFNLELVSDPENSLNMQSDDVVKELNLQNVVRMTVDIGQLLSHIIEN